MTLFDQDSCRRALQFAATAHAGQCVPGTQLPYVLHVTQVALEVMAAIIEERERNGNLAIVCALLHDVIEDTETPYEVIAQEFGNAVANGVLALSKSPNVLKENSMDDSLRRIREQQYEIWMVKLADRIVNLQPPPPHWTREKMIAYRNEAINIKDALGQASPLLANRLDAKINEYRQYMET